VGHGGQQSISAILTVAQFSSASVKVDAKSCASRQVVPASTGSTNSGSLRPSGQKVQMGQGVVVVSVSGASVVVAGASVASTFAMDIDSDVDIDMDKDMDKLVDNDMDNEDDKDETSSTTSSSSSLFKFRRDMLSFLFWPF
jgi:hypothetical protein